MKGYGVRLRVLEECDVALLAESADDAEARADVDVRSAAEFESIEASASQ